MKTVCMVKRYYSVIMTGINVRWAFNIKKWNPTMEEMVKCSTYIQQEEKDRIGKFYFKDDFKSSLIGRLLMRKFISDVTNMPYNEIVFKRDERGKPVLANSNYQHIKFNVSHQGDYVVLAGSNEVEALGVDTMKIEYKGGKELSEFFRIMNRQFTQKEWDLINQGTNDQKIYSFTRNWCLKESYVKAIGTGLNLNLQRLSFEISQKSLAPNEVTTSTKLYFDGEKQNWEFHEMLLDYKHCVAVAMPGSNLRKILFQELCIDELLAKGLPLLDVDYEYSNNYFKKADKS